MYQAFSTLKHTKTDWSLATSTSSYKQRHNISIKIKQFMCSTIRVLSGNNISDSAYQVFWNIMYEMMVDGRNNLEIYRNGVMAFTLEWFKAPSMRLAKQLFCF